MVAAISGLLLQWSVFSTLIPTFAAAVFAYGGWILLFLLSIAYRIVETLTAARLAAAKQENEDLAHEIHRLLDSDDARNRR